jgi:hypothetical protein
MSDEPEYCYTDNDVAAAVGKDVTNIRLFRTTVQARMGWAYPYRARSGSGKRYYTQQFMDDAVKYFNQSRGTHRRRRLPS